ncbi:hypothetical protein NPIL_259321 [Nephila pilipes]|uniref:Uncharacterized protein n=1 Tax=Nephila pilipes TaxID=299642 RepID=A0A8X6MW10_NEPPI|nr:hypothetical protein NPIL_259321 [Nephila pilipes]
MKDLQRPVVFVRYQSVSRHVIKKTWYTTADDIKPTPPNFLDDCLSYFYPGLKFLHANLPGSIPGIHSFSESRWRGARVTEYSVLDSKLLDTMSRTLSITTASWMSPLRTSVTKVISTPDSEVGDILYNLPT